MEAGMFALGAVSLPLGLWLGYQALARDNPKGSSWETVWTVAGLLAGGFIGGCGMVLVMLSLPLG